MNLKKAFSLLVLLTVLASSFIGCGTTTSTPTPIPTNSNSSSTPDTKPVLDKTYSLKYAVPAAQVTAKGILGNVKIAQDAGFTVELLPIAGAGQDFNNKLNVSLMSGDEIDLFNSNGMMNYTFSKANLLTELTDIAVKNGIDLAGTFKTNLVKLDGKIYGVPVSKDQWITLYNKKIFDDAKVAYPSADGWTWSKYIETAKKLTNKSTGIYGSYMLDYDAYNYMIAAQKKIPSYKADGTSNVDAPEYKDAMKFFYDLGNVEKIQPDFLTFKSKKLQWDDFARGKYGMFVCGSWASSLMSDPKSYPRDWKFGMLPMPSVDGAAKTALSIVGQIAIPSTTKHKNEAFIVANAMGVNFYKNYSGDAVANLSLTDAEITDYVKTVVKDSFKDEITVDEWNAAFKGIEPVSEKIIGPGANGIAQAFISEGEAYGVGQKKLEDALKTVKEKADIAIKADK